MSEFAAHPFHRFTVEEARALAPLPPPLTTSVLGMEAISHAIEGHVATLEYPADLYACFQRLSNARPQQERYAALLAQGHRLTLYGVPDWAGWAHPGLRLVALPPDHPLLDAWIVALLDPAHVSMALFAVEQPGSDGTLARRGDLISRQFTGFKTYDARIVGPLVAALRAVGG
jgi:hypothetical protein